MTYKASDFDGDEFSDAELDAIAAALGESLGMRFRWRHGIYTRSVAEIVAVGESYPFVGTPAVLVRVDADPRGQRGRCVEFCANVTDDPERCEFDVRLDDLDSFAAYVTGEVMERHEEASAFLARLPKQRKQDGGG